MNEMPKDWRDNDGWERYWQKEVGEPGFGLRALGLGLGLGRIVLRERLSIPVQPALGGQPPRILFAGNGRSPEPWLYANWGCACLALDVAPTACAAVEKLQHGGEVLERFYCFTEDCWLRETEPGDSHPTIRPDIAMARSRLAAERRDGGSVEIACADLFAYEPAAPVDAIVSRFAFQSFSAQDRDELAQRFARWLVPGGLLLVEGRFVPGTWEDFEERHGIHAHLREAGFFIYLGETTRLGSELGGRAHAQHQLGVRAGEEAVSLADVGMRLKRLRADELEREAIVRAAGGRIAVVDLTSG